MQYIVLMVPINKGNQGLINLELPTEMRNAKSAGLHLLPVSEVIDLINSEDAHAIEQASKQTPAVAKLVEAGIQAISNGGSVHYFGAGTSGRLATQDAAELYPTFHSPAGVVVAHMAGGQEALLTSVENAEDDIEAGRTDALTLGPGDLAIGLAASGRTPYVGGALSQARSNGAKTGLISCVPEPQLAIYSDITIAGDTGPEILTGSTRLKAATFQKAVLSSFSTAMMVGLGKTYSNLMVSMVATNEKLHSRSIRILMEGSGVSEEKAVQALEDSSGDLKLALISVISGKSPESVAPVLKQSGGVVQQALELINKK
jgi:N-acetylmuramic acid 6-phosphate etherase